MDSFVPRLYDNTLHLFSWLSPHRWLTRAIPRLAEPGWVELWVLLNLSLSALTLFVVTSGVLTTLADMLLVYGAIRMLEICVYLAKVVLGSPFERARPHRYGATGYRRTLVLAIHNYVEVIVWFAAAYSHWRALFHTPDPNPLTTAPGALYFSVVTMTTMGYADIWPNNVPGRTLVGTHLVIAVFMAVVILGRFVSNLPTPDTKDELGKHTK